MAIKALGVMMVLVAAISGQPHAQADATAGWTLERVEIATQVPLVGTVGIRAGYFAENPAVEFRGNVLYLQGLADSILNHRPLFARLSEAGYRVIAFDYMGQGGSEGWMNLTRIIDPVFQGLRISSFAEAVWARFAREADKFPRKAVIGWSTGGLAAYEMATRGWADAVVLIAPGLAPRKLVGKLGVITQDTLTSAVFAKGEDPHVEPISPRSPALVPAFAVNLLFSAQVLRFTNVAAGVRGLVFFGGDDSYVKSKASREVIERRAPAFRVVEFARARHEIDNEKPEIRDALVAETLEFLAQ